MSRINELFDEALKCNYPQYRGKSISEGKDFQAIFSDVSDYIQNFSISFNVKVEKSVGIGRWSAVPWIRVFYPDTSPSAQDGVYIVYLFSASGKSAFITLNQGTTDSSSEKRNRTRKIIQEKISSRNFLKNQGDLSFGDNKNYGAAAIFYKEYKADSLPSETEMNNDLKNLLEIYKECRDKGLLSENNPYNENDSIRNDKSKILSGKKEILSNQIKDFLISNFTSNPLHTRYIRSLLAKPFVILSGNSGTGKTRIAIRFAEYLNKTNIKNSLLIPVGADWTDNTKILGYYNPLANNGAGEYVKTDVFRFLEAAGANPEIPFFLILDEMNLSHVERYFSDFLSKMELLDFKSDKKVFFDIQGYGQLELPKNLFITGTVNIDETTYMFSPKVLDRANVIEFKPEMDDVLNNLIPDTSTGEDGKQKSADAGVAEGFMQLANKVRSGEIPEDVQPVLNDIKPILEAFYKELEKCGFEFAYRTAKEIRLYAIAAYKTAENGKIPSATEIADIQILQKILPKIHGNKKQIGTLLDELEKLCINKGSIDSSVTPPITGTGYNLSDSLAKIRQMKDKLDRFQYASFI